jgi:hypothetical protein
MQTSTEGAGTQALHRVERVAATPGQALYKTHHGNGP